MRVKRQRQPADLVLCTLTLTRSQMENVDMAARLLGLSRQDVLVKGFSVLSAAVGTMFGHDEHKLMFIANP